jgi:hypothetical protein
MQRWEYRADWVFLDEAYSNDPPGKFFKTATPTWCIRFDDGSLPLPDALARLGTDGWEWVGAVLAEQHVGTGGVLGSGWHPASHWLYSKRPSG